MATDYTKPRVRAKIVQDSNHPLLFHLIVGNDAIGWMAVPTGDITIHMPAQEAPYALVKLWDPAVDRPNFIFPSVRDEEEESHG